MSSYGQQFIKKQQRDPRRRFAHDNEIASHFIADIDIDSARPATVRAEDIKKLEFNDEDEGWAGAQAEVDYGAKLKFEDSDVSESDEDVDKQRGTEIKQNSPAEEQRMRNGMASSTRQRQDVSSGFQDSRPPVPRKAWGATPPEQHTQKMGYASHVGRAWPYDEMGQSAIILERRKRKEEEEARRMAEQRARAAAKLQELGARKGEKTHIEGSPVDDVEKAPAPRVIKVLNRPPIQQKVKATVGEETVRTKEEKVEHARKRRRADSDDIDESTVTVTRSAPRRKGRLSKQAGRDNDPRLWVPDELKQAERPAESVARTSPPIRIMMRTRSTSEGSEKDTEQRLDRQEQQEKHDRPLRPEREEKEVQQDRQEERPLGEVRQVQHSRQDAWGNRKEKEHRPRKKLDSKEWPTAEHSRDDEKKSRDEKKEVSEEVRKPDNRLKEESNERGKRNWEKRFSDDRSHDSKRPSEKGGEREDRRARDDERQNRRQVHKTRELKRNDKPSEEEKMDHIERKSDNKIERGGHHVKQSNGRDANYRENETSSRRQSEKTNGTSEDKWGDGSWKDSNEIRDRKISDKRQDGQNTRGRDRKESERATKEIPQRDISRKDKEMERRRVFDSHSDKSQTEQTTRKNSKTYEPQKKVSSSDWSSQKAQEALTERQRKETDKGEKKGSMPPEKLRSQSSVSTSGSRGRGRVQGTDRRSYTQSDIREARDFRDPRPPKRMTSEDHYEKYGYDDDYRPRREPSKRGGKGGGVRKTIGRGDTKSQYYEEKQKTFQKDRTKKPVSKLPVGEPTVIEDAPSDSLPVDNESKSSAYSTPRASPPPPDDVFSNVLQGPFTDTAVVASSLATNHQQSDKVQAKANPDSARKRLEPESAVLETMNKFTVSMNSGQNDRSSSRWSGGRGHGRGRGFVRNTTSLESSGKATGRGRSRGTPIVRVNSAKKFSSQRPGTAKNGWTKPAHQSSKEVSAGRGKKIERYIKQGGQKDKETTQAKQTPSPTVSSDGPGRLTGGKEAVVSQGNRGKSVDTALANQRKQQTSAHDQKTEPVQKKQDIQKTHDDVIANLDLMSVGVWVIDNAPDHGDRNQSASSEEGFTEVKSRATEQKEKREEIKRQQEAAEKQKQEEQRLALSKISAMSRTGAKGKTIGPRFSKGTMGRGSQPPAAAISSGNCGSNAPSVTDTVSKEGEVTTKSLAVPGSASGSKSVTKPVSSAQTEPAIHWSVSEEQTKDTQLSGKSQGKYYMSPFDVVVSLEVPIISGSVPVESSQDGYSLQPMSEVGGSMTAVSRSQQPIARPKVTAVRQEKTSSESREHKTSEKTTDRSGIGEIRQSDQDIDIAKVTKNPMPLEKGELNTQEIVKRRHAISLTETSVVSTSGILSSQNSQQFNEDEMTTRVKQAKYLWNETTEKKEQVVIPASEEKADRQVDNELQSGLEKILAEPEEMGETVVKEKSPTPLPVEPVPVTTPSPQSGVVSSQASVSTVEMSHIHHISVTPARYEYSHPPLRYPRPSQRGNQSRAAYVQTTTYAQIPQRHGMPPPPMGPSQYAPHQQYTTGHGQQPLMQPQASVAPYHAIPPPQAMVQPMPHQQGYGPHPLSHDFTYFSEHVPPGRLHHITSAHHPQAVGNVQLMPHTVPPHAPILTEPPQHMPYGFVSPREFQRAKQAALKFGSEVRQHDVILSQEHCIAPPTNMPDLPESVVHASADFYRPRNMNNDYRRPFYGNVGGEHRIRQGRSRDLDESPAGTGTIVGSSQGQTRARTSSPRVESQDNGNTTRNADEQETRAD
jgi:hypothetical protein